MIEDTERDTDSELEGEHWKDVYVAFGLIGRCRAGDYANFMRYANRSIKVCYTTGPKMGGNRLVILRHSDLKALEDQGVNIDLLQKLQNGGRE